MQDVRIWQAFSGAFEESGFNRGNIEDIIGLKLLLSKLLLQEKVTKYFRYSGQKNCMFKETTLDKVFVVF